MPFAATWMNIKIIILNEVRKRQISYNISQSDTKKIIQMSLFTKQRQSHRCRKQTYDQQKGGGGRDKLGDGD